jgi:hydrogenase-4 component B
MTPAWVAVGACAVLALALPWVVPGPRRSLISGAASALLGLAGVWAGASAVAGVGGRFVVPMALAGAAGLDPVTLAPTPLGGVFMIVAGGVGALAAVFGIGYAHGPAASRTAWSAYALFVLGMVGVPAASDVLSFLLAWELMAIASTVLVLADHATATPVRAATLWYAVMTHLSFLLLMAGFGILAALAGGTSFEHLRGVFATGPAASAAFVLLTLGFGTKAGLVPMHVWLPRAHPEAPSHVSAAMSAAMVKMGVYGLLLTLQLLPNGPRWWALLLLLLGLASALYGILQASVNSDLKRLLAYSTTENVGLIVTAIGLGALLSGAGQPDVGDVATVAALLLVVSHAAFKTALFLGAGSILHVTGERDLDRLGGLVHTHPYTAASFGLGALGATALPVTAGFVAEWVLLQALVHGDGRTDRLIAVILPLSMGVVALTLGLGLLTFVKAWGIAFLARPRSERAARPINARGSGDYSVSMIAGLLASGAIVVVLGFLAGPLSVALAGAAGVRGVTSTGLLGVAFPAVGVQLEPGALTLLALALAAPFVAYNAVLARRHPRRDTALPWGCGRARTSPRFEYTATSYAEPLVRIFGASMNPTRELTFDHPDGAPLLVTHGRFTQHLDDVIEPAVYLPVKRAMLRLGDAGRRIQNGSIHRYLAFSFAALLLVLLVVSL